MRKDVQRRWSLTSNRFLGTEDGRVCGVEVEEVEWIPAADGGRLKCVLLAKKKS